MKNLLRYQDFLNESVDNIAGGLTPEEEKDYLNSLEDVIVSAKKLRGLDLIWRGFNPPKRKRGHILKITEDRESTRGTAEYEKSVSGGKILELVDRLKAKWDFNSPVVTFTTFDKTKAQFFGQPYIFIPKDPFSAYQNPDIDDLLVDGKNIENPISTAENYEKVPIGETDDSRKPREVLFDSKEYYLISLDFIISLLPGKLKPSKFPQNYFQAVDVLRKWHWISKKKMQE